MARSGTPDDRLRRGGPTHASIRIGQVSLTAMALAVRGTVQLERGRADEAFKDLEIAAARYPELPWVRSSLGEACRMLGHYEPALEHLSAALRLTADDPTVLARRAAVYAARREPELAKRDLERALELQPGHLLALRVLRDVLVAEGAEDKAVRIFRRALRAGGDDVVLLQEYAKTLRVAGRYEEALDAVEGALWTAPDDPALLRVLGSVLFALQRNEEASAAYERAAGSAPDDIDTIVLLAWAQVRCDLLEEALMTAERALRLDERSVRALTIKSHVLCDMGAWNQAVAIAQKATKGPRRDTAAYQILGWALEHQDTPELALAAHRRAVRIDKTNLWSARAVPTPSTCWSDTRTPGMSTPASSSACRPAPTRSGTSSPSAAGASTGSAGRRRRWSTTTRRCVGPMPRPGCTSTWRSPCWPWTSGGQRTWSSAMAFPPSRHARCSGRGDCCRWRPTTSVTPCSSATPDAETDLHRYQETLKSGTMPSRRRCMSSTRVS
jgi:tetratricopeptide (TPR) repeat protein